MEFMGLDRLDTFLRGCVVYEGGVARRAFRESDWNFGRLSHTETAIQKRCADHKASRPRQHYTLMRASLRVNYSAALDISDCICYSIATSATPAGFECDLVLVSSLRTVQHRTLDANAMHHHRRKAESLGGSIHRIVRAEAMASIFLAVALEPEEPLPLPAFFSKIFQNLRLSSAAAVARVWPSGERQLCRTLLSCAGISMFLTRLG